MNSKIDKIQTPQDLRDNGFTERDHVQELINEFPGAYSKIYGIINATNLFPFDASDLVKPTNGKAPKSSEKKAAPSLITPEKVGYIAYPAEYFPEVYQDILYEFKSKGGFDLDVLGASLLWTVSTITGKNLETSVNRTWTETPSLWMAIVGRPGSGKSPAMKIITEPLAIYEKQLHKDFTNDLEQYESEDRKGKRPVRRQTMTNDLTVEGLVYALNHNTNGIGIFRDELNGFFKDLGRYSMSGKSGDTEFYLSAWAQGQYIKNRAGSDPLTVGRIHLPIIGSVQPNVLRDIAADNQHNGMLDRWLYTRASDTAIHFTDQETPQHTIQQYHELINKMIERYSAGEIHRPEWDQGAKEIFKHQINTWTDFYNDEDNDLRQREYTIKMKSHLLRLIGISVALHESDSITELHVLNSIKMSRYFIETAEQIFIGMANYSEIQSLFRANKAISKTDQVKLLKQNYPNMKAKEIMNFTGCAKSLISMVKD